MNPDSCANLPRMLFDQAARLGDRPFLWAKRDGRYRPLSWRQAAAEASRLSRGLRALGIGPGDRVALIAENRPEWLISDVAVMAVGAITVPAYTTNAPDDHLHVLTNSGAKAAIVSGPRLAPPFLDAARRAPRLEFMVAMEPLGLRQDIGVEIHPWAEVLARGGDAPDDVADMVARLGRTDSACIIHTSGTGGTPKGVMLSHGAILSNCKGALEAFADGIVEDEEVFLSFLPLSHSYEHTAGQFFPITIGAQIYYAEGAEHLAANMVEVRPTIMTAVPRLYETLYQRITLGVERAAGVKEKLFLKTLELGKRKYQKPESLGLHERLVDAVLDRLVRRRLRARFGGRLKFFLSGGAPLSYDIGLFFTALGVNILQGYGQTETAPVVSCNPPGRVKLHTVGPPFTGVEVRIAGDGEILVRGELVMQGYWGDDAATAEAIRDGWLHTGDIGLIDEDGYLQITDRKKDIIVNSGGDNVAPQRIEGKLTLEPEISQAMVYGDRRPYLVALIVPDEEVMGRWAEVHGRPAGLAALAGDSGFHRAIAPAVERVNRGLSAIERVRRFMLAREAFGMENGLLTPTLKIRRHKIKEIYGAALEALYGD